MSCRPRGSPPRETTSPARAVHPPRAAAPASRGRAWRRAAQTARATPDGCHSGSGTRGRGGVPPLWSTPTSPPAPPAAGWHGPVGLPSAATDRAAARTGRAGPERRARRG